MAKLVPRNASVEDLREYDEQWMREYGETKLPEGFFEDNGDGTYKMRMDLLPSNHRLRAPPAPSFAHFVDAMRRWTGTPPSRDLVF
jgi:hypothetical protein